MLQIREVLKFAKRKLYYSGIISYNLDAELLLSFTLKQSQSFLLSNPNYTLSNIDSQNYYNLITERIYGKPVSKIIGNREFYGFDFYISEDVLDPRADSEALVNSVLNFLPCNRNQTINILDLGTGSGCLIISLLLSQNNLKATASDQSLKALEVAKINQERFDLKQRLQLIHSNWTEKIQGTYDIIISNPPYIPTDSLASLQSNVKYFDPLLALISGSDGLESYRKIAQNIDNVSINHSYLFLEIGYNQSNDIIKILHKYSKFEFITSSKDLNNIIRVLIFKKAD